MIILDTSALYPLAKKAVGGRVDVASKLVEEEAHLLDLTVYELGNAFVIEEGRGLLRDPLKVRQGVGA